VENMSWWDALDFCNKLSTQKGLQQVYTLTNPTKTGNKITAADVTVDWTKNGYRLPTRAEWEYAAKGGHLMPNPPLRFAGGYEGGTSYTSATDVAWYRTNLTLNGSNNVVTHEVGQKLPNYLGTYDMNGNVSEMCWTIPASAGATQKVKGVAQVNPRSTVADILATSTTVANRYIYAAGGNWNATNSGTNENTYNLVVTWAWQMRLTNNNVERNSASADLADLYNSHGSWYGFRVVRNAQ
jgi:formylglycine-generating enzyme required for sulfatase activity